MVSAVVMVVLVLLHGGARSMLSVLYSAGNHQFTTLAATIIR